AYQVRPLVFWKRLDAALAGRLRGLSVPLLGPESTFDDPDVKAAVERALETEAITVDKLKLPESTGGFFRHEPRALVVHPRRLQAGPPEPDELNEGRSKLLLQFELPRGAYGTLVVKRIFRG